jgi:hypothetical protein
MQKWEYLSVVVELTKDGPSKIIGVNGRHAAAQQRWFSDKLRDAHEFFGEIGNQGWELVGVGTVKEGALGSHGLYFKRQKPE